MNVEDRLREALLLCRGDHQLGCREPALAILTANFGLIDASGEWLSECLGQSGDRQQHGQWIAMNEHQAGIGIYRADRGQREHMVWAFEHPPSIAAGLMIEVLQKALVKPIGREMAGRIKPLAVA